MNKIFVTAALIAAFIISPLASAGVSGSVGVESDHFWRGVNMTDGTALNLDLNVEHKGWSVDLSAIDSNGAPGANDMNLIVHAGYGISLTDSMEIHGGIVSYDWAMDDDRYEEFVVGGSYKSLSLDYYMNVDDSDMTYLEFGYSLPYISLVDIELNYGRFDDGEDVLGFTISKAVNNWNFSLMVLEEARHGEVMDSASFGIHYNF